MGESKEPQNPVAVEDVGHQSGGRLSGEVGILLLFLFFLLLLLVGGGGRRRGSSGGEREVFGQLDQETV